MSRAAERFRRQIPRPIESRAKVALHLIFSVHKGHLCSHFEAQDEREAISKGNKRGSFEASVLGLSYFDHDEKRRRSASSCSLQSFVPPLSVRSRAAPPQELQQVVALETSERNSTRGGRTSVPFPFGISENKCRVFEIVGKKKTHETPNEHFFASFCLTSDSDLEFLSSLFFHFLYCISFLFFKSVLRVKINEGGMRKQMGGRDGR